MLAKASPARGSPCPLTFCPSQPRRGLPPPLLLAPTTTTTLTSPPGTLGPRHRTHGTHAAAQGEEGHCQPLHEAQVPLPSQARGTRWRGRSMRGEGRGKPHWRQPTGLGTDPQPGQSCAPPLSSTPLPAPGVQGTAPPGLQRQPLFIRAVPSSQSEVPSASEVPSPQQGHRRATCGPESLQSWLPHRNPSPGPSLPRGPSLLQTETSRFHRDLCPARGTTACSGDSGTKSSRGISSEGPLPNA